MTGGRWAVACLAALGAGCATTRPEPGRLERRVRELEDQVYLLRREQQELLARLSALEGAPAGAGRARSGEPAARMAPPLPAPSAGTGAPRDPVRAVPPEPVRERLAPAAGGDPDAAWASAREAYDRTRFQQAIPLLQAFAASWPSDPRAVEAQYLIGESYYAEANFPQAVVEFGRVVESSPASERAPEALYKIALSYYELGYESSAREHLERLERDYPRSGAAAAARPLREKLGRR